ncbi:hypothetical protein HK099_004238 [Clydaea vesicula]|uniref:Uncharacterized protein n=1 Tax=Clydaea vesicula TaxID=447962 RepID=A0AAD5XVR8_9FUNG|nr:hypothetical protein HK099_004238 [Clydaea vesicula]
MNVVNLNSHQLLKTFFPISFKKSKSHELKLSIFKLKQKSTFQLIYLKEYLDQKFLSTIVNGQKTDRIYQIDYSGLDKNTCTQSRLIKRMDDKYYKFKHVGHIVKQNYKAPIGLFGFDELDIPLIGKVKYWGPIQKELENIGCKVFVPRVSGIGSIENRAKELDAFLIKQNINEPINFV